MDITELLKKIESSETTASDAQWLRGLMDENDCLWQMLAERHAAIRKASKTLLDIICELDESKPFRLTPQYFSLSGQAQSAIQQLKDALEAK